MRTGWGRFEEAAELLLPAVAGRLEKRFDVLTQYCRELEGKAQAGVVFSALNGNDGLP